MFNEAKTNVKILSSTSQEWVAGIQEGGSGTNYELKIITYQKQIIFDSIWVNKCGGKFIIVPSEKKDNLTLIANIHSSPEELKIKAPIKFKGEGLIRYTINGKKHYISISRFRKLPMLIYP